MLDHETALHAIRRLAEDALRSKKYAVALENIEAILFKTAITDKAASVLPVKQEP
ncbi:MAG: hypothetical protein LC723_12930 [Actinobacteria bacterium]|nr:hypothetical protein [Actinomycetota bacterium]